MGRNLVLCCDGTNNQFGSHNTNVVRLVQVLHRDPFRQRLYYDPGVGTLPEPGAIGKIGKKLSELKGLAFGAGLSRNVEKAYSYLIDVWEPGDRVFLFGFSRGAYTVRVLAALLHSLGLLPRGGFNLVPYVMRLFRAVRKQKEAEDASYWKLTDVDKIFVSNRQGARIRRESPSGSWCCRHPQQVDNALHPSTLSFRFLLPFAKSVH